LTSRDGGACRPGSLHRRAPARNGVKNTLPFCIRAAEVAGGLAVGHCAGVQYDHPYLNAIVPRPNGRQRLFALTYWRHIVFGNVRIFSLLENGQPRATIGYSVHRQFSQTSAPFLPPLCRALGELGRHVRIRAIHQLPASPNDGEAISVDGSFIPLRPENAHQLLAGQINLSVHTSQAELEACAQAIPI